MMDIFAKIIATIFLLGLTGFFVGFIGGAVTDYEGRFFERLFYGSVSVLFGVVVLFLLAVVVNIWIS